MQTLLQIRNARLPRSITLPQLGRLLGHLLIKIVLVHALAVTHADALAHAMVKVAVERNVVVARDDELERRVNRAQHVEASPVLVQAADHGEVAAVQQHVGCREGRCEGPRIVLVAGAVGWLGGWLEGRAVRVRDDEDARLDGSLRLGYGHGGGGCCSSRLRQVRRVGCSADAARLPELRTRPAVEQLGSAAAELLLDGFEHGRSGGIAC